MAWSLRRRCFFSIRCEAGYVGRIDDSDVKTVTSHDVRYVIEALLSGQTVPVEKTRVFGCSTKWTDKRRGGPQVAREVDQEPVELLPLDEAAVRGWRRTIRISCW